MEPKEIGQRLKAAREAKGYSQLDFALIANVSPSTVSRWERGYLPRLRELKRAADLLDVDGELLGELEPTDQDEMIALRVEVAELRAAVAEGGQVTADALRDLEAEVRALSQRRRPVAAPAKKKAPHR
jgi:transcriptional regulator with XRE-family HTH domain